MRRWFLVLEMLLAIMQPACATMVSGRYQNVPIHTSPSYAAVMIDGASAGYTPLVAKLKRRDRHQIELSKPGYVDETYLTKHGYNWWHCGNVLFPYIGLVGFFVDLATGAMHTVKPKQIDVTLTPIH